MRPAERSAVAPEPWPHRHGAGCRQPGPSRRAVRRHPCEGTARTRCYRPPSWRNPRPHVASTWRRCSTHSCATSSASSRASASRCSLALVCLLAEGHLLIEDVPGVGKTSLAKAIARSIAATCESHPVHARPPALRRPRRLGLEPGHQRVRVPTRRRLRARRARRRDQPRVAEDAVGPARGDGGAPGHRRHTHVPAPATVPGDRDAEPDRARGHLSVARSAARPVPDAPPHGLPEPRRRGGDPRDARHRPRPGRLPSSPSPRQPTSNWPPRRSRWCTWPPRSSTTSSTSSRRPARTRIWCSA